MDFRKCLVGFIVIVSFGCCVAQNNNIEEYVKKYKDVAIREMNQYHIPASIKLAQAILESSCGNSPLAKFANNHFGIKCNKDWTGETYFQDDDKPNECFRKYSNPEESYRDHSLFLAQRERYASLFKLEITDYKGWANGLKQCGYATNPKYPELLINLIEENKLYEYDKLYNPTQVKSDTMDNFISMLSQVHQNNVVMSSTTSHIGDAVDIWDFNYNIVLGNDGIGKINGKSCIRAKKGDTWLKLAEKYNLLLIEILTFNDATKNTILKEGDIVYLERKRKKCDREFHIVKGNETLRDISQMYGVRLKKILKKNKLNYDTELKKGTKILL